MGNAAGSSLRAGVLSTVLVSAIVFVGVAGAASRRASAEPTNAFDHQTVTQTVAGIVTLELDEVWFLSRGVEISSNGHLFDLHAPRSITFRLAPGSTIETKESAHRKGSSRSEEPTRRSPTVTGGSLVAPGGILLSSNEKRFALGDFVIHRDGGRGDDRPWTVWSRLGRASENLSAFVLKDVSVSLVEGGLGVHLVGDLLVAEGLSRSSGFDFAKGARVGRIVIEPYADKTSNDGRVEDNASADERFDDEPLEFGTLTTRSADESTAGPDVIVSRIHDVASYGSFLSGDVSAFSIGTWSCNAGDEPASWYANTSEHPVIAQNLYRLQRGRFEQIGMSWLKHGFQAVAGDICDFGCITPPEGSNQLGIGCSDPYSAGLNGQQSNLGPRSDVNAHTGEFVYPWNAPSPPPTIGRRLQVADSDIDPALNAGALYFVEAQYVTADDAAAGNQDNNAAYRRATFTKEGGEFTMQLNGITRSRWPAIRAWEEWGPPVTRTNVRIPGEGLVIVAARTEEFVSGIWHYEYAVQNLNSDRSVGSFSVPIEPGTNVFNIGFHDVDYHSGEPYSGTDWAIKIESGRVTWTTESFSKNPNANALRWGSLYNFRFDANVPPNDVQATIGIFKPGIPSEVIALTKGPLIPPPECGNSVVENTEQCDPPDGVLCDGTCRSINNNATRGGRLWDKWWITAGVAPVEIDHPLYPLRGSQTGSATWRCVECHGWDYKGVNGEYGSGEHFTGIQGVQGSALSAAEMFEIIKSTSPPNGHGYAEAGLADEDIRDLVQFISDLVIDTDVYIDESSRFLGDEALGQTLYETAGSFSCIECHGAEGTTINFGPLGNPVWIGSIATNDPWMLLHKIRMGQPGTLMPSWVEDGGSDEDAASIGLYAQLDLPAVCQGDFHCDDGVFCNGAETCVDGSCVRLEKSCVGQPCDEANNVCGQPDALRGGLLWDKWWLVTDAPEPIGLHPLYPETGLESGSNTFRCKECHGWDYQGVDGAYGSGDHFTGIPGALDSALTAEEMFGLLAGGTETLANGHGFLSLGLADNDIWDLVEFVQAFTIDTGQYIDEAGAFIGDPVQGEVGYSSAKTLSCMQCHGADGTKQNFGTDADPKWIGTIAIYNPWELLHKIRFGEAGSPMPSWNANGGAVQAAADIGRYAQETFPVDCLTQAHCEDGLFCTGVETCNEGICVTDNVPCPDGICEENTQTCFSTACGPPTVSGQGSRYLAVTPAAGTLPVALHLTGADPTDTATSCVSAYIQADGALGTDPVFQTPESWGTVFVKGTEIIPSRSINQEPVRRTYYEVREDCGSPGSPSLSLGSTASTWIWGDVDGNDVVNVTDVQLIVLAFQREYDIVSLVRADLDGCTPNGIINVSDLQLDVLAFQQRPFAEFCSNPCE